MSDVTRILGAIEQGDHSAAEELLPLVYAELRRLAAAKMASERPGQTLDATALVHEAYVRLIGTDAEKHWDGRGHFFAAAAEAMRRILVENARRKARVRHGGPLRRTDAIIDVAASEADSRLLELDEVLNRLAAEDPAAARVVELHHFAGLSHNLVAETLGVTVFQARQKWTYARAWLLSALRE